MSQLHATEPLSAPIEGLDPSLPTLDNPAELLRAWGARAVMVAVLAAAAIVAAAMPALDLEGGATLSLGAVTERLTLLGDGWVYSLTWFGGVLAAVSMLLFPASERFARTIAASVFSIIAMVFPVYVNSRMDKIDEAATRLGSGLIVMWILLGVAAVIPWVSLLWWNRMDPVLGRNWVKWLFLLPAIAWILLLSIFPLVYAFTTSRYAYRRTGIEFVGWENYVDLWREGIWGASFRHAVSYGVTAGLILIALAVVGYWLGERADRTFSWRSIVGGAASIIVVYAVIEIIRLKDAPSIPNSLDAYWDAVVHREGDAPFWIVVMALAAAALVALRRGLTNAEFREIGSLLPLVVIPVALIAFLVEALDDPLDTQLSYTVFFVVAVTTAEMILGFLLAVLMNRELKGRGVLRALMTLPLFAAPVGMGFLARTIFHETAGPLNSGIQRVTGFDDGPLDFFFNPLYAILNWVVNDNPVSEWLGIQVNIGPQPWLSDPATARVTTVIIDVWQWVPFVFVIALAGLQGLPQDVIEASEVDGASSWQVFRTITLPLMAPILWLILMLRAIDAFKVFDVAVGLTLGGPGRATEYYSLFNYRTARRFFDYGTAAVQAFLLLLIVSVLITLLWSKIKGIYEEEVVRA